MYLGSQFIIQIPVGLLGTRVRKVEAVALLRQNLVTCRALSSCRSDATSRSLTETWDLSSAATDSATAWRSTRTGEELRSCSLQNSTAQLAYHALRTFLPQVLSLRLKRRYLLRTRDRASERPRITSDSKCMYCDVPSKHPWALGNHVPKSGLGTYTVKPFVHITYILYTCKPYVQQILGVGAYTEKTSVLLTYIRKCEP